MAFHHVLLSIFTTVIWCHDLLFFDEFEFEFNLNNEDHWDYYHVNHNYEFPSLLNREYINNLYSNAPFINHQRHLLSSSINYASTCTNTIPLIMKQLCVHWKHDQGFKYRFQTPSSAHEHDTNWYYIHHNDHDLISDAKAADKYYSTLDDDMRYIGDDSDWNEINYANDISSFTMRNEDNNNHNFFHNFAKGSFKQCRHLLRMRECAIYHIPSKTLRINVKIGRARKYTKNTADAREVIPHNMYKLQGQTQRVNDYINAGKQGMDNEYDAYGQYQDERSDTDNNGQSSAYDFHAEFEYGDSMGYDHWANDVMHWKSFECMNCNHQRRRLYDDMASDYVTYGDYTYMFNEYGFDFDNDKDWFEVSPSKKMKCSIAIPGFDHKVCVDMMNAAPNKGAKITFPAADVDDVDYGYYDIYGYDAYYYNLDHLYKHEQQTERRTMIDQEDIDDEEYYDIGYQAMQGFYDDLNQDLMDSMRDELSDVTLHFLDDASWNDISTIYDRESNKYMQKCASFESFRLCATHSLSHPHKALTFDLRIGKHKYHRSERQKYKGAHPFAATMNYINVYADDDNDYEYDNDVSTLKQQRWFISDGALDIDDDEWDDPDIWHQDPSTREILTSQLQQIVRQRCRYHSYCLCQYMDPRFDHQRKHPCALGNPSHPQKVVHFMDDFTKTPPSEFIPLHHKHSPLKIEFHYKPHIQHLHVVGGIPYFHRRNHVKRYRVPWYKYTRYEHLRPPARPDWLPEWMWNEIGAHTHADPMMISDIMRDMKEKQRRKKMDEITGNTGSIGPQIKGNGVINRRVESIKKQKPLDRNTIMVPPQPVSSINPVFKRAAAHDIGDDNIGFDYYDYDAEFADELDDLEDDDASDMVHYVFPLMQEAVQSVMPVFEAISGMMGTAWNKIADKVGIKRRRMEVEEEVKDEKEWLLSESSNIRHLVKGSLPNGRPLWFPHYFWHWLHHAPHFHVLLHKTRVPWTSSARYQGTDNRLYKAAQDSEYNYYQYGDEQDVDYEALQDEIYQYEENDVDDAEEDVDKHVKAMAYQDYGDMAWDALGNGDDFLGNIDSLNDEMWRIESVLFVSFIGVAFCLIALCFVWRSKWGSIIRQLNQRRLERNQRLRQAKRMKDLVNGDDDDDSSSSLCISDVAPLQ